VPDLVPQIRQRANDLGFELVGIAPAVQAGTWDRLDEWLARGFSGEMKYIERRRDAYRHPSSMLPTVRSVVMLGMVYGEAGAGDGQTLTASSSPGGRGEQERAGPRVARYASGTRDYHDLIRERLSALADEVHQLSPGCRTRGVVDTAPLLERDFARLAGLGWFGKNTLLINKRLGSQLFLAALLTDLDLPADSPHETAHCGTCTRCLEACPTGAFPEPYVLDATRCISYLTIELRNAPIPEPLREGIGDWLFGCDICQDVCPWNRKAPATQISEFRPNDALMGRSLLQWLSLSPEEFQAELQDTPLSRSGWQGIIRNACIVAGNSRSRELLPQLEKLSGHSDPIVREAAKWAISRITQ
jgi:epoxyqueuosine reductase